MIGIHLPDDDAGGEQCSTLANRVTVFGDADALLASPGCYAYEFHVVGGDMRVLDGLALVRLLRRRSCGGLIAWRARAPASGWLDAGADLWLPRSATLADLCAAVRAVQRRLPDSSALVSPVQPARRLDLATGHLHSPQGVAIAVVGRELEALNAFIDAGGAVVPFAVLNSAFGYEGSGAGNSLHAAMYRLRRRIESATEELIPLSSQSGVGYLFRAALTTS
jgi:two-component system OmpR family response regulator